MEELLKVETTLPAPRKERTFNPEESLKGLSDAFAYSREQWATRAGKAFVIDEENKEVVRALMLYFSEHPAFNTLSWNSEKGALRSEPSLKKGLLVCGNVGSGKTLLLKIFNNCFEGKGRFQIVPCDILTDRVRKEGVAALQTYASPYRDGGANEILFDDLGIESKAKYYGDEINPMFDLIIKRYRSFCDVGLKSHFTTNLAPGQLAGYYDDRTESRLHEMCNIVVLGGSKTSRDRRK